MIISLDPSEKDTILGQTYDRLLPLLSALDRNLIIAFKQMVKKNEVDEVGVVG